MALVLSEAAMLVAGSLKGAIIVTYGAPGAMSSSVPDAQVENFNDPSLLGKDNNLGWSGVETISSVYIRTADMYGGAKDSDYAVPSKWVGEPNEVPSTTLA